MKLIVAVDSNWAIGYKNQLLVQIPADQRYFRTQTLGKVVVMGRSTLESFPGGIPLKDRTNIVITRQQDYQVKNAIVVNSIEEALELLKEYDTKDTYVIGGESIYRQMLDICDEAYVFAFFIGLIEPQKHLIRQVARKYDVNKVIYIKMAASEEIFNDLSIMEGIEDAGPKEFISLIKHAVAVCTDSYHAFVLSVIYHKNFHLMNRAYVPLNEVSNERWDSVMRKLGIENRYSNSRSEIMNLSQIDYEKVENQLNYLREESREWLIKALG